jgi:dTDP-4-dehydrorhamnose reductase
MKKILVTGARGMLGTELVPVLRGSAEVVGVDVEDFDITDADETRAAIDSVSPDVVVNCAGYTDVDGAETERELAFAINATGAGNVASGAAAAGARVLQIGTDYVFDGSKKEPYLEADEPAPLNVYGETKLAGEREVAKATADHLIVRTSWLYGSAGRNFVETILSLAEREDTLRVVVDQVGTPTFARDLAVILKELAASGATGVVNATNSGSCSWFGFARAILELAGRDGVSVLPVASSAFPRPARRPTNSLLDLGRLVSLVGWEPRPWREALTEYIAERQTGER